MTQDISQLRSIEEKRFVLLIALVFFVVIGIMMIVFSVTFIKDMQTLRTVPDAMWNLLCGKPTESNIALPLLLTIGIVSFGVAGGLQVWRWKLPSTEQLSETTTGSHTIRE